MKILVVEDDQTIGQHVANGLTQQGYTLDLSADGKDGLFLAVSEYYDLLIVDRMLPRVDGLTIVRTVRATNNRVPIILLTAMSEVNQRIEGLKAGADDYLSKPFAFDELLARVQVLLRRVYHQVKEETVLQVEYLRFDLIKQQVSVDGKVISLQPREKKLLEYLMRHEGQVVTRTMLLENVWDYQFDPQTNVIDVHVSKLRQKLDFGRDRSLIQTIRGAGYVIGSH